MKLSVLKFSFLAVGFLFSCLCQASEHKCGDGRFNGLEFRWCIDRVTESADVLYYLHGAGRSESAWQDSDDNKQIQEAWRTRGVRPPSVITVSFGPFWMLTDVSRNKVPALYPLFVKKIMPWLEAKIGGVKGHRLLKGESMGGFSASQILFRDPGLFSRAALVCPAISPLGPYASQADIEAFLARNKDFIDKNLVQQSLNWGRSEFPSEADWERHAPLLLAKTVSRQFPPLYLSCGDRDPFGFFEGVAKFAELVKSQGKAVTWEPLSGGHCVQDAKAIADFLIPVTQ